MDSGKDAQLDISRRMREALIKTTAVAEVPKSINALIALKEVSTIELQDQPLEESTTLRRADIFEVSPSQIRDCDEALFNSVYGKVAKRIMGKCILLELKTGTYCSSNVWSYPQQFDCSGFGVDLLLYHRRFDTSRCKPSIEGPLRGALNGGAEVQEVRAVRDIVIRICESAEMRVLHDSNITGWGWREGVATI